MWSQPTAQLPSAFTSGRWLRHCLDRVLSRLEDTYRKRVTRRCSIRSNQLLADEPRGAVAADIAAQPRDDRKPRFAGLHSISAKLSIVMREEIANYGLRLPRIENELRYLNCCDRA